MSQASSYTTMADFTYALVREKILSSELEPGQRIDQDALANDFGVSRMPIRETLRRLEAEGLVILTPHRGAVVAPLSEEDLKDLYIMRDAVETAAGRLGTMQISDGERSKMYDLIPEMEEIVERNDPVAWLEIDWTFHRTLYQAAESQRLLHEIKILRDEASRYRKLSLADKEELERGLAGHREILERCSQRDAEGVERIIRTTLAESRDRMLMLVRNLDLAEPASGVAE